ncbi:Histone-lysine N-methyltransferase SETMAR [Caligus rogercresseyi]|uniref:Histone-lysine N-methyltransferase SETMAR n=1 Tax=Caligus rogercresseyi TaxID=217165 RepID=A0A7T8KEP8_CALRO|nr:Histone-lysine N-methyltransferase SETMAR [Caligus rogercresseyi]
MDNSKEKIRHILLFIFDKGENASQAAENVNSVYGPDTVTANHAQFWFRRFRFGNLEAKDAPSSGRPIVENIDKIIEIVESDRHVSTVSITQELNIAQKTVWNHLNKAGYKTKLDVWIELSSANHNKNDPFLKLTVNGDKKWVTYDNVKLRPSWLNPGEPAQTVAKRVLSTIGPSEGSNRPAMVNRREIVFHNARPHTSLVTRHKLWELGWEVHMHPPYSPDLAPSDYYLFLYMANDFAGEKFASREACENRLSHFANREEGFYENGIMKLPSKWQQVSNKTVHI